MENNTNQNARQERQERWKRYVHKGQKTHGESSNVHHTEDPFKHHQDTQLPYEYWDSNAKPKDKSEKFNNFLFNAVIIAIFIIFFAVSMIMFGDHTGGHARRARTDQVNTEVQKIKQLKDETDNVYVAEEAQMPAQVDDEKFSLTFPAEPTRKTSKLSSTYEEYTAETNDSYVYLKKDSISYSIAHTTNISKEEQEEEDYRNAIEATCYLVSRKANKTASESDIERRSYNGRPAGYITFVDDSGNTVIATSLALGIDLFIKASTQERASEIFSTFQVK